MVQHVRTLSASDRNEQDGSGASQRFLPELQRGSPRQVEQILPGKLWNPSPGFSFVLIMIFKTTIRTLVLTPGASSNIPTFPVVAGREAGSWWLSAVILQVLRASAVEARVRPSVSSLLLYPPCSIAASCLRHQFPPVAHYWPKSSSCKDKHL